VRPVLQAAAIPIVALALLLPRAAYPVDAAPLTRCDIAGYRQHVQQLMSIVHNCGAQPSASTCDPAQVGPDDEVASPEGTHPVRYDWLRQTLTAAKSGPDAAKPGSPIQSQLAAASLRLTQDLQTASPTSSAPLPIASTRANLNNILAEHRFHRIHQDPNLLQRAWEALLNWILERLNHVAAYGGRNPWIARLLEGIAIITPCVLIAWWVMVRLRQQASTPHLVQPVAPNAPSAREWQRWLADADSFAQAGRWRDAVHHVYWAAISRLESNGLWPADRARTPREYLALLSGTHALQSDLRGLTQSFELIWYGNRPAAEQQYREARASLEKLVPR
jgi:hypothetical protein